MTEKDFVGGDGGPMIVLQAGAVPFWQGAADFENSLMEGGDIETDYDVICASNDTGYTINRHERDMLVLDDSEWGARIFSLSNDSIALVQQFAGDENVLALAKRLSSTPPSKSFWVNVQDGSLRLLVGADEGSGRTYGFKDVTIRPGKKWCQVFSSSEQLVVIIAPAPEAEQLPKRAL